LKCPPPWLVSLRATRLPSPPRAVRVGGRGKAIPLSRCGRIRVIGTKQRARHERQLFAPQRMIPKSAVAVFGQDHAPRTKGGRAPTGAWSRGRISGCGSGLSAARSPLGAPPRRLPRKSMPWLSPGRVSWDLRRAGYCPPSAVPVQRGTSRTGRVAGRSDARTARDQLAKMISHLNDCNHLDSLDKQVGGSHKAYYR